MRTKILGLILSIAALAAQAQDTPALNLLPAPQHLTRAEGRFLLTPSFNINVEAATTDTILYAAVNRMYQTANRRTGLYFNTQYIRPQAANDSSRMIVRVQHSLNRQVEVDESYTLSITSTKIILDAPTTTGALHGLETLLQLAANNQGVWYFPALTIKDAPRFAWRGVMIDVARHFIPVDVLKRNLDAMAAVKMNVLHLHLSDDEGFRIESQAFPLLQAKGSNGDYYTRAQMKDLITYAANRGIMIVPEFDMPGHTKSFLSAYPDLGSAPGPYTPGPRFNFNSGKQLGMAEIMQMITTTPTPTFDPTKESTYLFLDKFFGEMAALFPSPYIHIGADENNGAAWNTNPAIASFMKNHRMKDTRTLQAYFVRRTREIISKHGKQTIAWEEAFSPDLPNNLVVQVWSDGTYANKALSHGNMIIVSKGFYLDVFMPASVHYQNDAIPATTPESLKKQFLGGEAAQWSEVVDRFNIETRVWPRAAAIAERLWSPAAVNDPEDMYRRLFAISHQLDELGVQHLADYQRNLRRLIGEKDITPLRTLTDVLTPVKGYKKMFAKMGTPPGMNFQTAPLVAISDIVPVDSEVKRRFRNAVANYLNTKDQASARLIVSYLGDWKSNDTLLQDYFTQSPILQAIAPHSHNLQNAATIGLEAMDSISAGPRPDPAWLQAKLAALAEINKAYGETELAILPEIEALVTRRLAPEPTTYPLF